MSADPHSYNFQFPKDGIHDSVLIAPGANVIGRVTMGQQSSVWFNAVVRGDSELVEIGESTNIQDLCLVHTDAGKPCRIGNRVTLGHAAIVHGATIEDDVMIGIRATVLNDAVIGTGSLIAAGALVPEGAVIPPNSIVMGIPGKIVREATDKDRQRIQYAASHYVEAAAACRNQSKKTTLDT